MSVINWGIIGLGKIASNFASAFKDLKNSKIISIASQSNEKTEKFQKKFNLNNIFCYHNYEEMLSKVVFFGPLYSIEYEFDLVKTSTPFVNINIKKTKKKITKILAGL